MRTDENVTVTDGNLIVKLHIFKVTRILLSTMFS